MSYQKIKRIVLAIVLGFTFFLIALVGVTIVKKDWIINYFLNEANKRISTPIDVKRIDVSILNHFPNISINLDQVTIQESYEGHKKTLGTASQISFAFSPLELLNKSFTINGLFIHDAEVNLMIDENGNPNYQILQSDSTSKGSFFNLNNLRTKNTKVHYVDKRSDYDISFHIQNASSDLLQIDKTLSVSLNGTFISDKIGIGKRTYLNNKQVEAKSDFTIGLDKKLYSFQTGDFKIDNGQFTLTGNVHAGNKEINLNFNGVNTSFMTINSLLSKDLSRYFEDYQSKGSVYVEGSVKGQYGDKKKPHVSLEFGARNASFFHPKYRKRIEAVNLTGLFTSGNPNNLANYRLELKGFSCQLDDKNLEGQLVIQDFNNYVIDLILKGEADINTLSLLFPKEIIKSAFGTIKLNVHLNGNVKNPQLKKNFNADGDIELHNVSFVLTGERLPFNKLNGSLSLRKSDLAISDLHGFVGNSDFNLNGFFKDISGLMLNKKNPIQLQADLQSGYLDFDELLKSNFASRDTSKQNSRYEFSISPRVSLDFNCEIGQLKFRRFNSRNIQGQLQIKDQIAVLRNISFNSMGGKVNVSGSVNNKRKDVVETISEASLYNINIDSVFYVFKNFNQTWLVDNNLKGQVDADVNLYMYFNENLVLNSKSLVADIQTSIINGELNDFEPMMKLSKFVEEESLAHMRFSRMTNNIRIEDRIIYLPEMEIRSNVSNILVSGQHSFDKVIDYRLQVPLKNFIRLTKRSDFEMSARQGMNLMLKITGTTSDYRVSYDADALKQSIKNDIFDEGREWKNINNKTAEEVPALEDEYFEFDDTTDSTDQR